MERNTFPESPSFSIYDASAGSGKTYTLVKEYLKIILRAKRNDAYRNILAITFTNKAVHEMKSRIVNSLSELSKDEPTDKTVELLQDLSNETGLSSQQIKIKSQQIIRHIIHNYAAFDILTIDKFTHKVIRAFAHDLKLPITFEVTLDTENLLIEAVDALIAQAGEDESLTRLLVDFTMEKTDDDKSWDISREILEMGRLIFNENNREEISQLHDKTIPEFVEIKKRLIEKYQALESESQQTAAALLLILENNNIDHTSFSGAYFPKHLISIQQGKFNPNNKTYHEFEDIKVNKTATDKDAIALLLPELLSGLKTIYVNFGMRDFYKAFLKNITPLSLINTVSNELVKIQSDQNVLSIAEFNAIIHREIQNQPAPFIYERLGERYRHFFIDEFQDTSEMQWQNLTPLIDNSLSGQDETGQKGTLMIVGDPKQSIYRWRGGKAEQFIALSKDQNPFNNQDKETFHLETNYRSFSEVIAFNNSFFKFLSKEFSSAEYKDLYENHSFQKMNKRIGGYVNIAFLPETEHSETDAEEDNLDKNERYCSATLQTIQKIKQQGFKYKDITILTRKRDQGILIATYLTQQSIPLISSETLLINNASEVQFIVNVLRYLMNPSDIESKAYFLLYAAEECQKGMEVHDFILEGLKAKDEFSFEEWFHKFDISINFKNIRKKPLYECVEAIIETFITKNQNAAYLQYFLDIILERDFHKQAGVADFLSYWKVNSGKHSIPSPEGNDAVKIMTIHKSKGLEFPIVIFPFADEDYEKKPKDKIWLETNENDFGLAKVLIDNNKAVAGFGEKASAIYNQQKQEELLDNINILYVAFTRAEEQLYLISRKINARNDGNYPNNMAAFFTKFLLDKGFFEEDKLEYDFGFPIKVSDEIAHENNSKRILPVTERFNIKNIKIAQREALLWGTHQQKAIEYGNVIHEILSFIKTKEEIDLAITKAIEAGLIKVDQKNTVYQTIHEIITHKDLENYYNPSNKVLNEQTILQKGGKTIKPDRMILMSKNELVLLDYKTGLHQTKYQLQLENYQTIIEEMGFTVIKKVLVYIGKSIEVIHL